MEKKYDVFLSYAHADARTEEQKQIVNGIKSSIEHALKTVSAKGEDAHVFLDSEALEWGDEWSAKICRCKNIMNTLLILSTIWQFFIMIRIVWIWPRTNTMKH